MTTSSTRQRLEDAVLQIIREDGIAGLSARIVARRAGVNQALIFYHYDSLSKLIESAARASVTRAIEEHRERLGAAKSFVELLGAAQEMNAAERDAGNVKIMAQLVTGGHLDPTIGACARGCLDEWIAALKPTVQRLLADSPLAGLVEPDGLTRAVGSAFIGLELYEGVDKAGADSAMSSLSALGKAMEAVEALGPVATRAIRAHVRRRSNRR